MTEQEYQQAIANNDFKVIEPPQSTPTPTSETPEQFNFNDYALVLYGLRKVRRHITTAPTLTPKNFLDQIQFYDDGSARRIYFYINNTWRYATLT